LAADYLRIATTGVYDTGRYPTPSHARQAVITAADLTGGVGDTREPVDDLELPDPRPGHTGSWCVIAYCGLMSSAQGTSDIRRRGVGLSTRTRLLIAVVVGSAAGVVVVGAGWRYGLLAGWIVGAATFISWTWIIIWPLDPSGTASHATREDPSRGVLDVVVLGAAVASLGAVAALLLAKTSHPAVDAAVSLGSVAVAWIAVHTVFTARYADLFYRHRPGGIDFNEQDRPQYSDFAYLAFTIGMTFQVSDTNLKTKLVRATALRHALLSYLFGVIILAATINVIAGLAK